MGIFHDRLAEFGSTEGAVFPDGMFDALIAAYDEDVTGANDLSSAKIADLDALNAELNTQVASLKTKLYDLMTSAAVAPEADETFDDPDAPDEEDDADLDDFFSDSPDDDK